VSDPGEQAPRGGQVPDGWPPPEPATSGRPTSGRIVPLFPLPNVFLFPSTVMPLHIFEPRYRRMIEDSLDGPGRLVLGTVLEGHHDELAGAPPVHHVAGLGEIARHERLPDGRFVVMIVGLARVLIREVPSAHLYRQVEAIPLREVPPSDGETAKLRKKLREAVLCRTPDLKDKPEKLPGTMPIGHLTDLLLLRLQLPQSAMQDLFSCLKVADRARRALAEHARRPVA